MKKENILRDAIILFVITLIAGVLLGVVHEITLEPIAKAKAESAAATYRQIIKEASSFESSEELTRKALECNKDTALQDLGKNVSVDDVLYALNDKGEVIGYIVLSSAKGYGGAIQTGTGIDTDGTITGIGFLSINETPGLGMKAKEDSFTGQFAGMKDTSDMQAISGATSTSKAVKAAVDAAKYFFDNYTGK